MLKDEKTCLPHLMKYRSKRNQFKNLLQLSVQHNDDCKIMNELHAQALIFMFNYWVKSYSRNMKEGKHDLSFSEEPSQATFKFI